MKDIDKILKEMRPYNNGEAQLALARVLENQKFYEVLKYVFPNRNAQDSIEVLKKVETVNDFQKEFSSQAVEEVLNKTASSFSYSGIENIDKNTSYLFISNHRDIVLDSAILQYILLKNGHRTTQITFGSNLMSSQFIVDLGKINKMFTFYRGGSRIEVYKNALVHSKYIKNVLLNENESIWIAQRDGRTKNGDDRTQLSLLKMLTIKDRDYIAGIKQLNIVPISISYEYEPCDIQKVREKLNPEYVKSKDEDLLSILGGITGKKGKVHLAFGRPINGYIEQHAAMLNNDNIHQCICDEMDRQIHSDYQLNPCNYIAYDLLNEEYKYKDVKYTQHEISNFIEMIDSKCDRGETNLKEGLLKMYASPLVNALK